MDVGRPAAVRGVVDGGVAHQFILQIHDGFRDPDEENGVSVVQSAHFIWGQQFLSFDCDPSIDEN